MTKYLGIVYFNFQGHTLISLVTAWKILPDTTITNAYQVNVKAYLEDLLVETSQNIEIFKTFLLFYYAVKPCHAFMLIQIHHDNVALGLRSTMSLSIFILRSSLTHLKPPLVYNFTMAKQETDQGINAPVPLFIPLFSKQHQIPNISSPLHAIAVTILD